MINVGAIKFGEYVFRDEPYYHPQLGKLVDRDFFDRTDEKYRAIAILKGPPGATVVIEGERRSGKTSLLRLLEDKLASDPSKKFLPIYISYEGIESCAELVDEIIDGVKFKADISFSDILGLGQPELQASDYINQLRRLLHRIPEKILVVCIDELDSLIRRINNPREQQVTMEFINLLGETADIPLSLVVTLVRLSAISPFINQRLASYSYQIRLRPFSKEDLNEMVDALAGQRYTFTLEEKQFIYATSGGWPYFAKLILDDYFNEMRAGRIKHIGEVIEHAIDHYQVVTYTIEHIYEHHFNDREKKVILLLAKHGGVLPLDTLRQINSDLIEVANGLVQRDFMDIKGEEFYFRIGFWEQWFNRWSKFQLESHARLSDLMKNDG